MSKIEFKGKSRTKSEFKAETDINRIMSKSLKTGQLPDFRTNGVFADVSNLPDYQTSLNLVNKAKEAFMMLPSSLRDRFQNSPNHLIKFLSDGKNYDEAVRLGLINKRPEPAKPPTTPPEGSETGSGEQKDGK